MLSLSALTAVMAPPPRTHNAPVSKISAKLGNVQLSKFCDLTKYIDGRRPFRNWRFKGDWVNQKIGA